MASKNALGSTKVRKSYVEYVTIYEVTENELSTLENGGHATIMMDIAVSLLSIAITCLISLLTTTFDNDIVKNSFLFSMIICFVGGIVLLILSINNRKSVSDIIKVIKSRLQTEE